MEESKFFTKTKIIIFLTILLVIGVIVGGIFLNRYKLKKEYIKLENQMTNAAPNYLLLEKIELKENEYRKIDIKEIIKDKLVSNSKASDCSGYVIAKANKSTTDYKTYLKCKNIYITEGYGSKTTGSENKTKTQTEEDTTKPVITLLGAAKITINLNSEYKDLGATAYDNIDKDITKKIKVKNEVDTSKEGTYKVTYSVTDTAGNKATKTRTVIVKEKVEVKEETKDTTIPVITFMSPNSYQNICLGNKVDISKDGVYGYTATDDTDGDITNNVKIEGDINITSPVGTYTLRYTVKDAAGNEASATRTFGIVNCDKANTTTTTPSTQSSNTSSSSSSSTTNSNNGGTPSTSTSSSNESTNTPNVTITNTTIDVKSIEAPSSITINVNETYSLNATVTPSNATNKTLKYSSTNSSVVSVTDSGVVKGLKQGEARVIITSHNGIQKGVLIIVE